MAAEPIRSICFLEAHALMRLVNDSIATRDTFRLVEIDRLLFNLSSPSVRYVRVRTSPRAARVPRQREKSAL
jgi:hypothetical protein